jgi:hypothetical protein
LHARYGYTGIAGTINKPHADFKALVPLHEHCENRLHKGLSLSMRCSHTAMVYLLQATSTVSLFSTLSHCHLVLSMITTTFGQYKQPTAVRQAPHPYCDDLISYLRVTFMNLSTLPASMREAAHFTCMTHVCDCMLQVPPSNYCYY